MKIYGILGKNVGYSLSPCMHNAAFKALGLDAEYKVFDIPENELDDFFSKMRKGEISGCNVTIPYKEKALDYVDRDKCDNMVQSVEALNTIVNKNGVLEGHNTDDTGFINALTGSAKGDLNFEPGGKSVFVFGAGGAARTVIFSLLGLHKRVKKIAITDIDINKAKRLASSVEKQDQSTLITVVGDKEQYNDFISKSDLLVNATPCGMKEDDPPLFDYRYIHERLFVFDLIYVRDTILVKEAQRCGAKAINGLNMLLDQAVEAFECYWVESGEHHNKIVTAMNKALKENIKLVRSQSAFDCDQKQKEA